MELIEKIEQDLKALRRAGELDGAFERWRAHREEVGSFSDADALIGFLRDPAARPRRMKDGALAALCAEATGGDETAATLLLWLMVPGLLVVRRRLDVRNRLDHDDLDAELLAGMWEAATAIGPATTNVALRLLARARRRALAAARRSARWSGWSEPLRPRDVERGLEADPDVTNGVLSDAVRTGIICEEEAELFRATRGTIGEVRARLGLTVYGAQNRRRRARERLLEWLATSR